MITGTSTGSDGSDKEGESGIGIACWQLFQQEAFKNRHMRGVKNFSVIKWLNVCEQPY
jgi:hypothetical protein